MSTSMVFYSCPSKFPNGTASQPNAHAGTRTTMPGVTPMFGFVDVASTVKDNKYFLDERKVFDCSPSNM